MCRGSLLPLWLLVGCVPPEWVESARETAATAETAETAETGDSGGIELVPPTLVLVIIADDLAPSVLWAMPNVTDRLAPDCVRFDRAYVTVPLCCPSRASLFAGGQYPRDTGVLSNESWNGGYHSFVDARTLPTRLQAAGLRTGLVGKYLNGYGIDDDGRVPPGWSLFVATGEIDDAYGTEVTEGSSGPDAPGLGVYGATDETYIVDWLTDRAVRFLEEAPETPTVLFFTPPSPHGATPPALEDRGTSDGYSPRPPSFEEADTSDKPAWLQEVAASSAAEGVDFDASARLMQDNLGALDRGIGRLLDTIEAAGLADRTAVILTSDNGMLHGEHWLSGKGVPYEEAVRVPLLMRVPGVPARDDARLVAVNLDLPATLEELLGLEVGGVGASLRPALEKASAPAARSSVFLEGNSGDHPVWAGVVTERWKYVQWADGARELYDLDNDRWEMESLHQEPPAEADLAALGALIDEHRSLAITTTTLPVATVGESYSAQLESWGGTPPVFWEVAAGALPEGLTLDPGGRLDGVPELAGTRQLLLRVVDSVPSPVTGHAPQFSVTFDMEVVAGAGLAGPSPAWERLPGEPRHYLVRARPGASVRLLVYGDDTRDDAPRVSAPVRADASGRAVIALPALPPSGVGHLFVEVDGLMGAAERVRR